MSSEDLLHKDTVCKKPVSIIHRILNNKADSTMLPQQNRNYTLHQLQRTRLFHLGSFWIGYDLLQTIYKPWMLASKHTNWNSSFQLGFIIW